MSRKPSDFIISVVVPAYNEEKNIAPLCEELRDVLEGIGNYEIIIVDDGSSDNTYEQIKKQTASGDVKAIGLNRNFGKGAALNAGIGQANGKFIVTMDADLQDDPNEIPKLLDRIRDTDEDMIVGWKFDRKDSLAKIIPSKIFNFLVRLFTGIELHDIDSNLRIFTQKVKDHLDVYGGHYRYIPVIADSKGFKVGEKRVRHRKRQYGRSKWGFGRLVKGFFDLLTIKYLTSYSNRPLHPFGLLGGFVFSSGFVIGSYLLFVKFAQGQPIGDRPLLLLGILMMIMGMQWISIGLLSEFFRYNRRKEIKDYVISEIIDDKDKSDH